MERPVTAKAVTNGLRAVHARGGPPRRVPPATPCSYKQGSAVYATTFFLGLCYRPVLRALPRQHRQSSSPAAAKFSRRSVYTTSKIFIASSRSPDR